MELHVWGLTELDADRARADAEAKHAEAFERAQHLNVTRTIGMPCPIRRRDSNAIAQAATYHMAWALYPSDTENSGGTQP